MKKLIFLILLSVCLFAQETRVNQLRAEKIISQVSDFTNIEVDQITYSDSYWDDLRFPATTIRQGATTKPDFDTDNLGLLFPQNDADEIAYIIAQFPHSMKTGSEIKPHIHYWQTSSDTIQFKMDYRWMDNGDTLTPADTFKTVTCNSLAFAYVGDTLLQICSFPSIIDTSIDAVSSILDIKIYRDDNIAVGDVLVKEFDIHYQIDAPGSRTEFVK